MAQFSIDVENLHHQKDELHGLFRVTSQGVLCLCGGMDPGKSSVKVIALQLQVDHHLSLVLRACSSLHVEAAFCTGLLFAVGRY
jgi:hypothetical protein